MLTAAKKEYTIKCCTQFMRSTNRRLQLLHILLYKSATQRKLNTYTIAGLQIILTRLW